jgi:ABC-type molybdate transport system substrate-binding protein
MRSAESRHSPLILAFLTSILVAALAGCADAEPIPTDLPGASLPEAASVEPDATLAARTIVHIDAPVELAGLLARIESAYEIGHPGVDLAISLAAADALAARLRGSGPADLFLVDSDTAEVLAETGAASTDPIPFAADQVALLADRAPARDTAIEFLAWLVGAEGRAIVSSAGLAPPP